MKMMMLRIVNIGGMDDDDGAGENAKKKKIVLTSVDWRRMADQHTMPPLIDTEQTLMQRYIK